MPGPFFCLCADLLFPEVRTYIFFKRTDNIFSVYIDKFRVLEGPT